MVDLATIPDECYGLDEIERQTTLQVNHRTPGRRGRTNWGLPPNIARASASREAKKPAPPVEVVKPAPVEVVVVAPPRIKIKGRVLAEIADYDGLWSAVRVRLDAMGITRREFDHLTGLQEGYSGKLLGEAQRRRFGKESLGATLGGICCKLVLVEDPEATAKMMARINKRKQPRRVLKLLAPPAS